MNGTGTLYYTVTDHLGSIVQLIDENGNVIEETNFGPWGRYRNPNTWQYDNTAGLTELHRGYTGHEMMNNFDLIHMNGRMYDPALGRMLSPDNYVQDPNNPNNYNRYAYCMNNPLKYTDPSGESAILFATGFLLGSYLAGSATNDWDFTPWDGGNGSWNFSDPALYFNMFMGGVAGAALLSTGYGLLAGQSAMNLNVGLTMGETLKGGASFLVNNSGIMFQGLGYSTIAGGGGFLTYEMMKGVDNTSNKYTLPQMSKWEGVYFQGTEKEAKKYLTSSSKMFNVETSYWKTSRGYYFEPIHGNAYKVDADYVWGKDDFNPNEVVNDYNYDIGYMKNSISSCWRFTYVEKTEQGSYLIPNLFNKSRIFYHAHTHPSNRPPSSVDITNIYFLNIAGKVFGWNGVEYNY